jgi:hypothetical protein
MLDLHFAELREMPAMTDHDFIDKKTLSEGDICTKFITPAIKDVAGWEIATRLPQRMHVNAEA